ncbi:MAG TPA: hypothetical protein VN442_07660 [Bryobacteraceae bacterium]|nr:hypothetical protein [Bryobacteraceae bacterium]
MFRSDQLIREETIARDVKQRFPEMVPVFPYGRPPGDPYDIESPNSKAGLEGRGVVDGLHRAACGSKTEQRTTYKQ